MTALALLAASFAVALLVGKFINFGSGEDQ